MQDKKILVIEDDKEMSELLSIVLKKERFFVSSCEDGAEALRRVKNEDFDLVVSDIQLPGVNGIDILKDVKSFKPELPVFLISGVATDATRERIKKLDCEIFFEKPFSTDEFVSSVREVVSRDKKSKHILVVDDHKGTRDLIRDLLKETKYEVDCAGNGKEAIDLVKKAGFSYDIAFVDLIMPIVDGVETVKFFKKHSPATLIVMITGEADLSIVKKCYRAGAHMFWRKPFRIQNFIEDFRNLETASNALKEEYQEKQKLAKQPVYKKIPRKCKDFVRSIAQSNKKREVFYHIAVIIGFAMLYWAGMQVYQKIEDSVSHFTSRYDSVIDKIENYVEGLEWNKINTSNLMRQGLQNLQKDVYQKPSQLLNRSNDTNGFDEFPKRYNLLMDKMQNYIDNLPKVGEGLKGLDINKYYNIYPSEYLKRDGKRFYIELDEPMRRAIYSDTFPRR